MAKHSSLLGKFVNYGEKSFIRLGQGGKKNWIKIVQQSCQQVLFIELQTISNRPTYAIFSVGLAPGSMIQGVLTEGEGSVQFASLY